MYDALDVEQRVQRAHMRLMRHPWFCLYSGLFMVGEVHIKDTPYKQDEEYAEELAKRVAEALTKDPNQDRHSIVDSISTQMQQEYFRAMTNGRDVWYGRGFIESCTEGEVEGAIIHENKHKAYRHAGKFSIYRHLYDINAQLAGMAMDYVINLEIDKYSKMVKPTDETCAHPVLVKDALLDYRFEGMDTTQVFKILMNEGKGKDKDGNDFQVDVPSTGACLTCKCSHAESGEGEGGDGNGDGDGDGAGDEKFTQLSDEEAKAVAKEIDQALREGTMLQQRGTGAGGMSKELGDLLHPKVPWNEILRDEVKEIMAGRDDLRWNPCNRRYVPMDIYLPSAFSERVGPLCISPDVSGSCIDELPVFMSEVQMICTEVRPSKIELIYWDSNVERHETYETEQVEQLVDSTAPVGGGGTTANCIPPYLKDKQICPEMLIIFTDGYIERSLEAFESLGCKVLWCVLNNPDFESPIGKTIHIDI